MTAPQTLPPNARAALAPPAARLLDELRRVRKNPSDDEAVHDARVAGRRLLAGTELWLEAGTCRGKLQKRLEKCVRRLGRVRNLDVSIAFLKDGPAEDASARKALARKLKREAKLERKRLAGWLERRRVERLKSALSKALAASKEDAPRPAPARLETRLRKILRLASRGKPMDDPPRAHELRQEIRFLRYQQESIRALYSADDDGALAQMFVRLQEAAGEWHDRFVIDRQAAAMGPKPRLQSALKALRIRLAAEMRERSAQFEEALEELARLRPVLTGARRGKSR